MAAANAMASLASELVRDARSEKAMPALFCGLISAVLILVFSVSMAAVIFSGPLSDHFAAGAGVVLFGYCMIGTVVALTSGLPGAMAGAPMPSVVMMVVIAGSIDLEGQPLFVTAVSAALIGTAVTGLCFLAIGHFRLASFLRFIPYPVAGGFIAGTGGLACVLALELMGITVRNPDGLVYLERDTLQLAGIGIGFGVGLFALMRIWRKFYVFPVAFAVAAILFHAAIAAFGMSADEAREAGLLFSVATGAGLWPPFEASDLAFIDWGVMTRQIPNILILAAVTLICVVMNLGGIELAANCDLDWNHEFKAAGWANALTGFGGAPPGCLIALTSIRNSLFGAMTRLTGLVTALTLGFVLLTGDTLLKLFPVHLIAGVLLFLGIQMVDEWLVRSWRKLVLTDYAAIVVVFLTIVVFGFLEGVGVGMAFTSAMFVISLSGTDMIGNRYTLRERQSRKTRPIPDRAILLAEGQHAQGHELRGYLFFGTAYRMADQLRLSLKEDPVPRFVLLGFRNVSGFDFSAVNALARFVRTANAEGVTVVIYGASDRLRSTLRSELPKETLQKLVMETGDDRAIEKCEDLIIENWRRESGQERSGRQQLLDRVVEDLERHLERLAMFERLIHELAEYLEPRTYSPGESIVAPGVPREGMQLLQDGQASQHDATGNRLIQFSAGDVIEPGSAFGPIAADLATIAEAQCRTLLFTPAARERLARSDPKRALELYEYVLANIASTRGIG
ncbi:MAG: STAS domain-containing protein [Boseongicola sp. SB0677_bin_26]|nr:STAS domain-containing protein [Boseongicola sp. SB0665_bin_10]MYG26587.1 STAS domain-containing protein [Boseongicola sp. SB0677_bin_26]